MKALTLHEKDFKANLINYLADIYKKAKAVVILNTLILKLRSTDPVKTTVILYCDGKSTTGNYRASNGD